MENISIESFKVGSAFSSLQRVTPLSKYLALLLFIILPFWGGYIGYVYAPVKIVEVENVVTNEIPFEENEFTDLSPKQVSYYIENPKSGDHIPADKNLLVTWNKPEDKQGKIYIYLTPDFCEPQNCDYQQVFSDVDFEKNGMVIDEYVDDIGSHTFTLPQYNLEYNFNSGKFEYPQGTYRIVLKRAESETGWPRTILAVSDTFEIVAPIASPKKGEVVGAFTVESVFNYSVTTIGTTTVSGNVYVMDGILAGQTCFDVTPDDAWKIPRVGKDNRSPWFCFRNEVPESAIQKEGTTTIEIANYEVDARPIETTDSAEFVRLVE